MTEKNAFEIIDGDAVPAFTCLVYVRRSDDQVTAQVANLAGIQASAKSEREVLAKVIPAFKRQVARYVNERRAIPWIDPVRPLGEDEQKRIVPVHL